MVPYSDQSTRRQISSATNPEWRFPQSLESHRGIPQRAGLVAREILETPKTVLTGPPLDAAIAQLPSRPTRDTFFRATRLIFASDPLGRQRPIGAQRFNVARGARILYLADDQVTALHEAQALGFPARSIAIIPVPFDLRAVVDLRDPLVHRLLQTDTVELSMNFRSLPTGAAPAPTQMLGERVVATLRIDGLLYESPARPGHLNLAVIEAALRPLGSSLVVNDPNNNLSDTLP
jgi:RES domain-containing protein